MEKKLDEYVFRNLKLYGNAYVSYRDYKKIGRNNIINELKEHGFNCNIKIYDDIISDCFGNVVDRDKNIILQVR